MNSSDEGSSRKIEPPGGGRVPADPDATGLLSSSAPPAPADRAGTGEGRWRERPLDEILERGAAELGVPLDESRRTLCLRYLDLLLEWNTRMNLTAVRDPHEAVVKLFLDSLTAVPLLPERSGASVIDVGTGAGFPGLVLKIVRPDLRVVLLDSVRKRLGFLEAVMEALGLDGVEMLHSRAEDAGRDLRRRERFDLVTARAVAELRALSEWCLPLTRIGGRFLAMKGPRGAEELHAAGPAIERLGGQALDSRALRLPYLEESRLLIVIRKTRATPRIYPRSPADIEKRPL